MGKPMTLLQLRDAIAKAIADEAGHGMREKCERQADAVLKVVAPQLLATADDATLRQQSTNPPGIDSKLVGQQAGRVDEGLFQRACEVVHHETGCSAIGGNGDADCCCDAVPFLRDLKATLVQLVSVDAFAPIPEAKDAPTDELWAAYNAFNDRFCGFNTQQALRDAINTVLANRSAIARCARVPEGLRERIERAWHDHDEEGRVHISMGDARLLVEQVLAAEGCAPGGWPRVWGTARVADNPKFALVSFDREPTDGELIAFDDAIKAAAPSQRAEVKERTDHDDPWNDGRRP